MSPVLLTGDTNEKTGDTRYRVRIAKSERTRDGHLEVLVDHNTDGQWRVTDRQGVEVMSKRPTIGKVKPGITFFWKELWEILRDHKLYQ